jgi:hypothetical protein
MPPVTFRAEDARLITRTSADRAGLGDYTCKRDFRRDTDQDIRREGYDYFWPNTSSPFASNPGGQPFPNIGAEDPTGEAITLIHFARRPNGRQGIIVGTKTKLWRFFGNEDGEYYDSDYFEPVPAANAPYYAVADDQWLLIGSGFSEDGHRWEAIDINGYTVLNNGVDLPMTYRLEDVEVSPIYELREQGIASVGTIGEISGILMCGDISEIHTEEFLALMAHVGDIDGGNMTASKEAGITFIVTPADFFDTTAHVGRTIVFDDGTTATLQSNGGNTARQMKTDYNPAAGIPSQKFKLRNKASQVGATFSGLITGDVSSTTVTASSSFFSVGMVGKTIRFSNGFSATISAYTDVTHVTIDAAPPEAIVGLPFWVTDAASLVLVADADVFTVDMVGRYIVFDSGEIRQIQSFTDAKTVIVDSDSAMTSTFFQIENTDSFDAFTDESAMDRVHYRTLWSMPDEPRRFGAIVAGTIEAGGQVVTLKFPTKSFEAGQEIIIAGAGVDEGNLTVNILSVSGLGQYLLISEVAETSIEEQPVEQSDAQGSIVGFEDLQDDSSGILRILNLSDVLVIYKETCIFTAVYTGSVDNPFDFRRLKIPESLNLVYRWTLVDVGGQFHVYAGANAFYRLDLSSRVPRIVPEMEMIADRFFTQVSLDRTDEIFGADNGVTNEIFWFFPSTSEDKAICLDYKSSSASTSTIQMTAAATVRRLAATVEPTERLFLMGTSTGTIVVYGRADASQASWVASQKADPNGGYQIFYRRSAYPFSATQAGYDSELNSGLGDFGDSYNSKDATEYVLRLASQSPNCGVRFSLYGYRNPNENPDLLLNEYMPSPQRENLFAFLKSAHFFKYSILISGSNNPCRIAQHTFNVSVESDGSHDRRQQ